MFFYPRTQGWYIFFSSNRRSQRSGYILPILRLRVRATVYSLYGSGSTLRSTPFASHSPRYILPPLHTLVQIVLYTLYISGSGYILPTLHPPATGHVLLPLLLRPQVTLYPICVSEFRSHSTAFVSDSGYILDPLQPGSSSPNLRLKLHVKFYPLCTSTMVQDTFYTLCLS